MLGLNWDKLKIILSIDCCCCPISSCVYICSQFNPDNPLYRIIDTYLYTHTSHDLWGTFKILHHVLRYLEHSIAKCKEAMYLSYAILLLLLFAPTACGGGGNSAQNTAHRFRYQNPKHDYSSHNMPTTREPEYVENALREKRNRKTIHFQSQFGLWRYLKLLFYAVELDVAVNS